MLPTTSSFQLADQAADATARNARILFDTDPEFRQIFDDFDADRISAILDAAAASAKLSTRRGTRRSDIAQR